jgi:hypothetical protein
LIAFGASLAVAEQAEGKISIQAIVGKADYESDGGWKAITKGMNLDQSVVVKVGMNSRLVVKSGERTVVIPSLSNDSLGDLVATQRGKGVVIGGKAVKSDLLDDEAPDRTNVPTASTRAEVSSDEIDWEE